MNALLVDQIVNAVLYEGYILYPYRSASKRSEYERSTFGRVYPQPYSEARLGAEANLMQTECLFHATRSSPKLNAILRFLQPMPREIGLLPTPLAELPHMGEPVFKAVPALSVGDKLYQSWQEAVQRQIKIPALALDDFRSRPMTLPFSFPASRTVEPILCEDRRVVGVIARRREFVAGVLEIAVEPMKTRYFKITLRVLNQSPLSAVELADPEAVTLRTFAATHMILHAEQGEFVSLMDPPPECKAMAEACNNLGAWPVLVGDESKIERDTLLSSPMILCDYPQIVPKSADRFEMHDTVRDIKLPEVFPHPARRVHPLTEIEPWSEVVA